MKPKPSLFARLLTISGLELPFCFFVTVVLEPILTPVSDALDEAKDPSSEQQQRAAFVRKVARHYGLDVTTLLLNKREQCEGPCGYYKLLFIMPDNVCWDCWRVKLKERARNSH